MFEQEAVSSGFATKRLWTTCLGLMGEVLLVACAALAPLASPQALPHSRAIMAWLFPTAPEPPPVEKEAARARAARPIVERLQQIDGRLREPVNVPPKPAVTAARLAR